MKTPPLQSRSISRRGFLCAGLMAGPALVVGRAAAAESSEQSRSSIPRRYRAAIIGHTGAGDYGHGYDQIFKGVDPVSVEALADPDPEGRARAANRSGARRQYSDYREMLAKEKPDLVSIATRHPRHHRDMALATIEVCRGLFIEKPFTEALADADAVLQAAARRNVKIQVAHNRRYTGDFVRIKALLAEGFAGAVRQVNIHGKQDARSGGEDLIVLGTHDFDLMRFCFGDPSWCSASITVAGRDAGPADMRPGQEPIRVAGDTIRATFGFPGNLAVHWESVKTADHWNTRFAKAEKWAFEILGTRRIIAYQSGANPDFGYLDSPFLLQSGPDAASWKPLPEPEHWNWPEHERHPIRSLLHAIEQDTEPVCSGADGRWAIEMVAAIYASHRTRSRVSFPLQSREGPSLS